MNLSDKDLSPEYFEYRVFDDYDDVVISRTFECIPRFVRLALEELLNALYVGTDYDIDTHVGFPPDELAKTWFSDDVKE